MRRALPIAALWVSLGVSCVGGAGVGILLGVRNAYHRQFLEEQRLVEPILASDPAFARVEIHEYSAGGIWLGGKVKSRSDLERLEAAVTRQIGESRAKLAVTPILVEDEPDL